MVSKLQQKLLTKSKTVEIGFEMKREIAVQLFEDLFAALYPSAEYSFLFKEKENGQKNAKTCGKASPQSGKACSHSRKK